MCCKLGFRRNCRFKGTVRRGRKNPATVSEFGCVCGFAVACGKTTISKELIFKTFDRLQKVSAEELACTGKGILALAAVPEDILLQLPEEL